MNAGRDHDGLNLLFTNVTLEPLTARAERHGKTDSAQLDRSEIVCLQGLLASRQGRFRAHIPISRFERFEMELVPAGRGAAVVAFRVPPHVALSTSAIVGGVDSAADDKVLASLVGVWQQVYGRTLGRTVSRLEVHERPALVSLPLPGSMMQGLETGILAELQATLAAAVLGGGLSANAGATIGPGYGEHVLREEPRAVFPYV